MNMVEFTLPLAFQPLPREASERFCWILQEERKMREQERELREESQQ